MPFRKLGLIAGILALMVLWSGGIAWLTGLPWFPLYGGFVTAGAMLFFLHYQNGVRWMQASLQAHPVRYPALTWLARQAGLRREPQLYVTRPLPTANAFTVSGALGDAIFVSPDIWEADDVILMPVLAHELAHIRHRDSLVSGFITSFAQVVGSIGRSWTMLLFSGPFGWVILFFLWPVLLSVHVLSALTLATYHPFAAALMREKEFMADAAAARWTSPEEVIYALRAIDRYNRRGIMGLFLPSGGGPLSTHPPVSQRVQRLRETYGVSA